VADKKLAWAGNFSENFTVAAAPGKPQHDFIESRCAANICLQGHGATQRDSISTMGPG
jgi:hypothetical protein